MLWGSLSTLNALRIAKGLNTIALRPHAGESGAPLHLGGAYLFATSINHGIRLSDSAVLQYLFYVDQVKPQDRRGLPANPPQSRHSDRP